MRRREAQWTYRLSPPEIAEIETAVKAVQARGLDIADIRREDFPLPTLGPVLDRLRAEVLDGRGFALFRGMPVEERPIAESATAYWGVGTYFGSARSQNAQGHLLGHVYDLGRGLSATNPNLRSYTTAERQNFHIDRCDVVALLCLRRAKSGGLSTIVSSMSVRNVMAERRPDLLDRLYQPFPVDRRGEVPEGKAPFYEAPVFNEHAGYVSVLYSRLHIGSAQRFPEARRLTAEDLEALDMLTELAGDPELRLDMNFMPGDIQFLRSSRSISLSRQPRTRASGWANRICFKQLVAVHQVTLRFILKDPMTRPRTPGLWTHNKVWLHQVSSPDAITPSRNLAVGGSGLRSTYAPGSSAFLAELRANAIVVATLHGVHEEALEEAKSRKREERNAAPPPATRIIQTVPTGCVSEDRFESRRDMSHHPMQWSGCASRRRQSSRPSRRPLLRDRRFEFRSLHQRVSCEP